MSPRRPASAPSDRRPPSQRRRGPRILRQLLAVGLVLGTMGGLGVATGTAVMLSRIPSVESLLAARPLGSTTVYDREGRLVASLQNGESRELVPLEDISEAMQHAVIASEDIRFYEHHGIDPRGLARAVLSLGRDGGGSTLTQQLAKNLFLSFDRTATRKVADMWLAVQLERTLPKKKILEMYLNQVYFGHGAYGVEAAAHRYFGKKARALNAAEAAMLAGLLPAPEYYSPYRHPEAAKEVQGVVLKRMVDAGYLEPAQAEREAKRRLRYPGGSDYAFRAPYFISQVLATLSDRLGADLVMRGGLKIYTTLDLRMQETAEGLIRRGVARYARMHVGQGALVAIEPGTGAVRVLVGGTDYGASQFNRATQAHRQPGSTFKPFVYLTAFTQGYTPYSTIADSAVSYGSYTPQNYDRRYHGTVSLETALARSLNIPAVKIANGVGIDKVIKLAHAAGIQSDLPYNLSVALGSAEVTPLELATAYATFAADGMYVAPRFITRVEDKDGNVIDEFPASGSQVVDGNAVAALHQGLMAVIRYGSGGAANFGRPAAGKTGTTSDNRDTWFAGYTPQLACVIWLGNDDNSRLASSATGGGLAAPLWARFMGAAHEGLPVRALLKSRAAAENPDAEASPSADPNASASPAGAGELPASSAPATAAPNAQEGQPLEENLPTLPPEQGGTTTGTVPTSVPVVGGATPAGAATQAP